MRTIAVVVQAWLLAGLAMGCDIVGDPAYSPGVPNRTCYSVPIQHKCDNPEATNYYGPKNPSRKLGLVDRVVGVGSS